MPDYFKNHALLLMEPWCFHPAQVARMTPEQVDELYLKPAKRVGEIMKKERGQDDEVINPFADNNVTFNEFANKIRALSPGLTDERVRELWQQHLASE